VEERWVQPAIPLSSPGYCSKRKIIDGKIKDFAIPEFLAKSLVILE
jgi:hypothetical protein